MSRMEVGRNRQPNLPCLHVATTMVVDSGTFPMLYPYEVMVVDSETLLDLKTVPFLIALFPTAAVPRRLTRAMDIFPEALYYPRPGARFGSGMESPRSIPYRVRDTKNDADAFWGIPWNPLLETL